MSKFCAKCEKTVFPMEELKCLDKTWHKGCFKCTECSMTLNMKTYKGFNKSPYCEAHIPKAKATTVAETPELRRIQENTKIQSNAVYHAEFEKAKGKFTMINDDPELMRIKQNSKIISNAAYHGDIERKAQMEQRRNLTGDNNDHNSNGIVPAKSPSYMDELSSVPAPPQQRYGPPPTESTTNAYSNRAANNYHHSGGMGEHKQTQQYHPPPMQQQQQQPQQYHQAPAQHHPQQQHHQPIQNNPSPYSARGSASSNLIYTSDGGQVNANNASKQPGSIADYDPVNNYYGSLDPQIAQSNRGVRGQHQSQNIRGSNQGPNNGRVGGGIGQQPASHHVQQQQQQQQSRGVCYRALYDYEAQDVDEVSFTDGDFIVDCTPIDEGWLTGTVQRTGSRGMLPANYVASA